MPDVNMDRPQAEGPSCPECGSYLILPDGSCAACGSAVPQGLVHDPEIVVPNTVEPVSGWRSWSLDVEAFGPDKPLLRSVTHSECCWPPREEVVARCPKFGMHAPAAAAITDAHRPPVRDCGCGLYAARTYEHLMTMTYHTYDGEQDGCYCVVGEVAMWGGIIPGTQGWRGEKAYPTKLFLPFEAHQYGRALRDTYGVRVQLRNILGPPIERVDS